MLGFRFGLEGGGQARASPLRPAIPRSLQRCAKAAVEGSLNAKPGCPQYQTSSGAIDAVLFRGASTRGLLTVRSARRMGGGSRLVLIADVSGFSRVSGLDPFVGILVGHASLAPFVDLLLS